MSGVTLSRRFFKIFNEYTTIILSSNNLLRNCELHKFFNVTTPPPPQGRTEPGLQPKVGSIETTIKANKLRYVCVSTAKSLHKKNNIKILKVVA